MASNRMGRINEEVQRELAALIPNVKDPRVSGMISVTAVDVTPDLKFAKVYISVLDQEDNGQVLKGLKSAAGYLRRELGRALNLRHTPELTFFQDDSMSKGAHILEMLRNPEIVKPANPANEHIILDEED
ncbi:MAG: 30S ribosome-binding factor RbfA [Lawsonibacter sp.]|jgi:ribosome-binding factor A|nr:30S ribosome-binding factor RbfA [Lawsonibacter sp.]